MAKRINTLNTASSPANDDYLPIDGATNGTRKISADFVNNLITDVEVDGTSVVTSGVAEIDLSGKQDILTAGSNITIAQDGTISATDTTYTAGTNVDITGGIISATDTTYTAGTNVTIDANNVISATDTTYTAGTNVQINNGVISATDTTYSAFGGATAGADGTSGLVPQPLIADKDKFLKGDGTWDTIQPGASALDDLTNVDITSPTNGQVLKYDSTNQEWVNANESGGGGGSTVIPNPTGTPTDTLDTVSIDGTIYEIQGGGGGNTNGFVKLAEYSGSGQGYAAGDTITLSDDMTNYDMLVFATNMFASPNVYGVPAAFVTVDDFKTRYTERFFTWYEDTTGYNDVNYVSDTSIYVLRVSRVSFHAIYGVKFGGSGSGGGGGSGEVNYSTTEHKVGTWIDGSDLYERTINITTGSFTATQDMDISNYIDSTEVVRESIGVFNYTYQGANYATPINGRETEIINWNGTYKLRLNFGSGSNDSMDAYITIRYTKTSS